MDKVLGHQEEVPQVTTSSMGTGLLNLEVLITSLTWV